MAPVTRGAGSFDQSMNLAAIWQLPVIFFCENNGYAMSSPARDMLSVAHIVERAVAYGIPGGIIDGNDVLAVRDAVAAARCTSTPWRRADTPEAKTYRNLGHSRGDLRVYRTREEEAEWARRDPIAHFRAWLLAQQEVDEGQLDALSVAVAAEIAAAEEFARASAVLVFSTCRLTWPGVA